MWTNETVLSAEDLNSEKYDKFLVEENQQLCVDIVKGILANAMMEQQGYYTSDRNGYNQWYKED